MDTCQSNRRLDLAEDSAVWKKKIMKYKYYPKTNSNLSSELAA